MKVSSCEAPCRVPPQALRMTLTPRTFLLTQTLQNSLRCVVQHDCFWLSNVCQPLQSLSCRIEHGYQLDFVCHLWQSLFISNPITKAQSHQSTSNRSMLFVCWLLYITYISFLIRVHCAHAGEQSHAAPSWDAYSFSLTSLPCCSSASSTLGCSTYLLGCLPARIPGTAPSAPFYPSGITIN